MHGTSTISSKAEIILEVLKSIQLNVSKSGLVGVPLGTLWGDLKGEGISHGEFSDCIRQLAADKKLSILAVCVNLREMQKGGVLRNNEPRSDTVRVDVPSIPEAWLFISHFALDKSLNYLPQGSDGISAFLVRDFRICLAEHCPSSMLKMKKLIDLLHA